MCSEASFSTTFELLFDYVLEQFLYKRLCIVGWHANTMLSGDESETIRESPERSVEPEKKKKGSRKKKSDSKAASKPTADVEPEKKKKGSRKKKSDSEAASKPAADGKEPKKRAPRAKKIVVVRKTAFEVFPEGHSPADKEVVAKMINEFMDAFVQKERKDFGFQTMGETAELRYLNQLLKNPDAQPEKRSVARDNRTAYTPSTNPFYDPRVLTHSDEEEYETLVMKEPVYETCTDRLGAQHTFDSNGYHRRDQLVYVPEYIKRIPAISPAALQDDKMRALHKRCSELVFGELRSVDDSASDETIQSNLKILGDYKDGLIVTDLKDWAALLLECAKLVLDCETDSDDAETVDWSITSSMCGDSEVGVLVGEIEDFIDSLDA